MKLALITILLVCSAAAGCTSYSPRYPAGDAHPSAGHHDGDDPYHRPADRYRRDGHSGHSH
jgi:hypothetical protein